MFTGIVQSIGIVLTREETDNGCAVSIRCPSLERNVEVGESISINGVCLTVEQVEPEEPILYFHTVSETLEKTNLGTLDIGDEVNVEPSLRAGDTISGHFVTGHIEGVGTVEQVEEREDETEIRISAGQEIMQWLVSKGCVALDGISLTPVDVNDDGFSVVLIPETLRVTTMSDLREGTELNVEVDLLAKYAANAVRQEELPADLL